MNKILIKRFNITLALLMFQLFTFAQNSGDTVVPTLDSTMRSNDKIYVVMAVCLLILVTLLVYLIRIDLKISRKEKI